MRRKRVDLKAILADKDLRRDLMVSTIQATQAREGIDTNEEQADRAYSVVTEVENAAFFSLERFRGGKRFQLDRREEKFVRALTGETDPVRFDVARRDFDTIDESPLAYAQVKVLAAAFRDYPSLEPHWGVGAVGLQSNDLPRFVRFHWEHGGDGWTRYAKGADFTRFFAEPDQVVHWGVSGRAIKENPGAVVRNEELYFRSGIYWTQRTQKGFSVKRLPAGCIFDQKAPSFFPLHPESEGYLLAVLNSGFVEYLIRGLVKFGSYGKGAVCRIPVPRPSEEAQKSLAKKAMAIFDAKAEWDSGNEISVRFRRPWFAGSDVYRNRIPRHLDSLLSREAAEEARIQQIYAELNDEVYKLYSIPGAKRAIIEDALGERPLEILWPQMEKKTTEQKRMEHVWRLLSYVVKRVVEADEDGIVPFTATSGESALLDRVRTELAALFPYHDINQVEIDITNELKRKVKGYRRVESIGAWIEDVYFAYHVALYKKRPILWHIASNSGRGAFAFGALAHYHKFDHDRLAKLRGSYLRDAIAYFRREAGLADREGRNEDRQEWQHKLEEAQALDQRLQWVQEGANGHPAPGDCRIRTPWKSDDELPDGWQPDLDDGVAVNILPLQTAGVLRIPKVV